jgi:ubiquinone/menaquinone biosynthesis C-methylase UbiE
VPKSPSEILPGAVLASALWWYAATVLEPARILKRLGVPVTGPPQGEPPRRLQRRGLGPHFSRLWSQPVLLKRQTSHDELVAEFDRIADVYDLIVHPFSAPIVEEAVNVIRPYLAPDARILDAGCGAGREAQRFAQLVPNGEVVGVDLAAGMVLAAHRSARAHGLDNTAFVQSDVGDLPKSFSSRFDLAYSFLAHHHYPEPGRTTAQILRCLRPGGLYCVVDPGPEWYNQLSAPLARWADPGWIGFHTPTQFQRLFLGAGFVSAQWIEVLPGFGVAIGQKRVANRHAKQR